MNWGEFINKTIADLYREIEHKKVYALSVVLDQCFKLPFNEDTFRRISRVTQGETETFYLDFSDPEKMEFIMAFKQEYRPPVYHNVTIEPMPFRGWLPSFVLQYPEGVVMDLERYQELDLKTLEDGKMERKGHPL